MALAAILGQEMVWANSSPNLTLTLSDSNATNWSDALRIGYGLIIQDPQTFFLDFSGASLPAAVTFTRSSSGTYFNNSGVLSTATTDTARFNYSSSPAATGTLLGLLIEPAATNLFQKSNNLLIDGNPWFESNGLSNTANAFTSPDGTNDGWSSTATSNFGIMSQGVTISNGTQYTFSAWLKYITGTVQSRFAINFQSLPNDFPLSTTIARYSQTITSNLSGSQSCNIYTVDGAHGSVNGIFGVQMEVGAVATSYIQTSSGGGGTASRSADVATFTIPDDIGYLTFEFDDSSTQTVAVTPGSYTIPTNLNRPNILNITGVPSTMYDSMNSGHGLQFTEQFASSIGMADSDTIVLGMNELPSDTLTMSDAESMIFGFNSSESDTLSMSDSLIAGYGNAYVEQLTFSDSKGIGYGDLIADTLAISDAFADNLASAQIQEIVSDTMTMSDSIKIGYGLLPAETLSMTDFLLLEYDLALVESFSLSMTDALVVGYGDTVSDTMTMSDSVIRGDGFGLSESFNLSMTDAIKVGYGDALTDILTLTDALKIGYGEGNVDQLILTDATGVGYGDKVSDTMAFSDAYLQRLLVVIREVLADTGSANWKDAIKVLRGLVENLNGQMTQVETIKLLFAYLLNISDTLTLSDALVIAVGSKIADAMSMSDALGVGYGDRIADVLTLADSIDTLVSANGIIEIFTDIGINFSDAVILGIGDLIADTMVLSDALVIGEGLPFSDAMTELDSMALGYGLIIAEQITLSDVFKMVMELDAQFSDTLALSDSLQLGYGNIEVEQLVFSDTLGISYGDLIADAMSLSDFVVINLQLNEQVSDTLTLSDSLSFGDGLAISDSLLFSEAVRISIGLLIAEAMVMSDEPGFIFSSSDELDIHVDQIIMLDALTYLLGGQPSDQMVFSDSLAVGDGNAVTDQMAFSDSIFIIVENDLKLTDTLTLSDSMNLGYGLLMSDALIFNSSLTLQDFINGGIGLQFADELVLADEIDCEYGLQITDTLVLSDFFISQMVQPLFEVLADDNEDNWNDVIAVFAGIPSLQEVMFITSAKLIASAKLEALQVIQGVQATKQQVTLTALLQEIEIKQTMEQTGTKVTNTVKVENVEAI